MRSRVVIVVGLLALTCLAGVVVETLHSFIYFGARSKQSEARSNLKRLCVAQRSLLADQKPSSTWRGLGEELERGNRYAYFVSPGGTLELRPADHGPVVPDPEAHGVQVDPRMASLALPSEKDVPAQLLAGTHLGANGPCPKCEWVMVAVGNIDAEPDFDIWSISTGPRSGANGERVEACEPYLERNDLPLSPLRRLFH